MGLFFAVKSTKI